MKVLNTDSQPGLPDAENSVQPSTSSPAAAPTVSTADRIKAIEAEVGAGLNLAANIAGSIDPALLPFIVLGRAAATALPGIIDDVQALIDGGVPSPEDNASIAQKIAGLNSPENL